MITPAICGFCLIGRNAIVKPPLVEIALKVLMIPPPGPPSRNGSN